MTTPETLTTFFDQQYKANPANSGEVLSKGTLKWKGDKKAKSYRTRLMEAWQEAKEPNFANKYYAVTDIGCGTGCQVIFIIDWHSGEIFYPPRDDYFEVRKDSRLIILKPYAECSSYGPPILFVFDGAKFTEVKHDKCSRNN